MQIDVVYSMLQVKFVFSRFWDLSLDIVNLTAGGEVNAYVFDIFDSVLLILMSINVSFTYVDLTNF